MIEIVSRSGHVFKMSFKRGITLTEFKASVKGKNVDAAKEFKKVESAERILKAKEAKEAKEAAKAAKAEEDAVIKAIEEGTSDKSK